jgi:hypothetical protein
MSWRRIVLRHVETGESLSDQWRPMAREQEMHAANAALEQRDIPYRWAPEPAEDTPPLPPQ